MGSIRARTHASARKLSCHPRFNRVTGTWRTIVETTTRYRGSRSLLPTLFREYRVPVFAAARNNAHLFLQHPWYGTIYLLLHARGLPPLSTETGTSDSSANHLWVAH